MEFKSPLDNEVLINLANKLKKDEFRQIMSEFVTHSIKKEADLQFDFNKALNYIIRKFPGRDTVTVNEVHQSLRDLGIIDFKPDDFIYIEDKLKRYGLLVVPG